MRSYTKQELIDALRAIKERGWIANARLGNAGGVGNTLEDLLDIPENNLPIPNASEWELKCQRAESSSLTTLLHMEPSPRALRIVPSVLLPKYGWKHQQAGTTYPDNELSFRQTIHAGRRSDRGFKVEIDRTNRKVVVSFNAASVSDTHSEWLSTVIQRVGRDELDPQPYWGFDDLFHKAGIKLPNCFYVQALVKRVDGREMFWYNSISKLQGFSFENLLCALEEGSLLVDFDARTHHNHGTKFRLRQGALPKLYSTVHVI